jgi:hypothetical protein
MSATKAMVEFRNKIAGIYLKSVKSPGSDGVSIDDILKSVKVELKSDIENLQSDLIEATLRAFVYNVGRRKTPLSLDGDATSLFEEYKRIPHGLKIGGNKLKPIAHATIAEVRLYIDEHERKSKDNLTELKRLTSDLEQYKKNESDSFEVLMQRRNKRLL